MNYIKYIILVILLIAGSNANSTQSEKVSLDKKPEAEAQAQAEPEATEEASAENPEAEAKAELEVAEDISTQEQINGQEKEILLLHGELNALSENLESPEVQGISEIRESIARIETDVKNLDIPKIEPLQKSIATISTSINAISADLQSLKNTKGKSSEITMLIIVISILIMCLLISVIFNRALFKWRRSISDEQISIIPSELISVLERQNKSMSHLSKNIDSKMNDISKNNQELAEIFSNLRSALNEKDEEIKRYKSGYDLEIFRKFLIRFIHANEALEDLMSQLSIESDDQNDDLIIEMTEVKELLEYALKQTEVEKFSPSIGQDIREAFGLDEQYRTKPAQKPEQIMTIAEVRECGYRVKTPDDYVCIIPAKVVVYVQEENIKEEDD